MPLETERLAAARMAATRLREAEADLERLRAAHRHAVRALHRDGATLREIAAALGLSHQRVHQLVGGDGEGQMGASARPAAPTVPCRLCGEASRSTLCGACHDAARRLIAGEALDGARGLRPVFRHNRRSCVQCGRLPDAGERFAEGGGVAVCGGCLNAPTPGSL